MLDVVSSACLVRVGIRTGLGIGQPQRPSRSNRSSAIASDIVLVCRCTEHDKACV